MRSSAWLATLDKETGDMSLATYYIVQVVIIVLLGVIFFRLSKSRHREKAQWFGLGWAACVALALILRELIQA